MLTYDLIVIGFGKAGKTLAAKLASAGKKVALIERNKAMYGGTCINIGCIPTKTLLVAAEKDLSFDEVMATKNTITTASMVKTMLLSLVLELISLMPKPTLFQTRSSKFKPVMKNKN